MLSVLYILHYNIILDSVINITRYINRIDVDEPHRYCDHSCKHICDMNCSMLIQLYDDMINGVGSVEFILIQELEWKIQNQYQNASG